MVIPDESLLVVVLEVVEMAFVEVFLICLVNSDNERDSSLLNSLLVGVCAFGCLPSGCVRQRAQPNRFIMTGPSGSGSRLVSVAACGWVVSGVGATRRRRCLSARRTKAARVGQRVGSLRFRPRVLPYHQ